MLFAIWKYRYFILSSIRNELVHRFVRSKLGGLWVIINPLSQVLIYALILSNILAAKLPGVTGKYSYAIYLMAGLLAWTLFNEIINRCLTVFIEQGNLIKKMNFPRISLPLIVAGSSWINNMLLLTVVLVIFVFLGHQFSLAMLWLLPLSILVIAFAISCGIILGLMNVFLRDIGQLIPVVLQILFWFTPIVYPVSIIPAAYRHLLELNPLYPIVNAYQEVIVYGRVPQFDGIIIICLVTLFLLGLSLFMFRRANAEMVDVL